MNEGQMNSNYALSSWETQLCHDFGLEVRDVITRDVQDRGDCYDRSILQELRAEKKRELCLNLRFGYED